MRRLWPVLLGCGAAVAFGAVPMEEGIRNFVACPIVRDTATVPCWLAEYDGELYFLTLQSDVSAPVRLSMLAVIFRAAGLPEPRRLPRASAPAALGVAALSGSHPVPLAAELAALRAAVEAPHEVDVDAAKIHALDVKARRLRAEHEVALRLVEEENARATEHAKRAKREAADDAKRAAAQHESMVAKFNAERAAEDALVAASRARSTSTGNPAAA